MMVHGGLDRWFLGGNSSIILETSNDAFIKTALLNNAL